MGGGDERVKARPRARMGSIESDAGITVNAGDGLRETEYYRRFSLLAELSRN